MCNPVSVCNFFFFTWFCIEKSHTIILLYHHHSNRICDKRTTTPYLNSTRMHHHIIQMLKEMSWLVESFSINLYPQNQQPPHAHSRQVDLPCRAKLTNCIIITYVPWNAGIVTSIGVPTHHHQSTKSLDFWLQLQRIAQTTWENNEGDSMSPPPPPWALQGLTTYGNHTYRALVLVMIEACVYNSTWNLWKQVTSKAVDTQHLHALLIRAQPSTSKVTHVL